MAILLTCCVVQPLFLSDRTSGVCAVGWLHLRTPIGGCLACTQDTPLVGAPHGKLRQGKTRQEITSVGLADVITPRMTRILHCFGLLCPNLRPNRHRIRMARWVILSSHGQGCCLLAGQLADELPAVLAELMWGQTAPVRLSIKPGLETAYCSRGLQAGDLGTLLVSLQAEGLLDRHIGFTKVRQAALVYLFAKASNLTLAELSQRCAGALDITMLPSLTAESGDVVADDPDIAASLQDPTARHVSTVRCLALQRHSAQLTAPECRFLVLRDPQEALLPHPMPYQLLQRYGREQDAVVVHLPKDWTPTDCIVKDPAGRRLSTDISCRLVQMS